DIDVNPLETTNCMAALDLTEQLFVPQNTDHHNERIINPDLWKTVLTDPSYGPGLVAAARTVLPRYREAPVKGHNIFQCLEQAFRSTGARDPHEGGWNILEMTASAGANSTNRLMTFFPKPFPKRVVAFDMIASLMPFVDLNYSNSIGQLYSYS